MIIWYISIITYIYTYIYIYTYSHIWYITINYWSLIIQFSFTPNFASDFFQTMTGWPSHDILKDRASNCRRVGPSGFDALVAELNPLLLNDGLGAYYIRWYEATSKNGDDHDPSWSHVMVYRYIIYPYKYTYIYIYIYIIWLILWYRISWSHIWIIEPKAREKRNCCSSESNCLVLQGGMKTGSTLC